MGIKGEKGYKKIGLISVIGDMGPKEARLMPALITLWLNASIYPTWRIRTSYRYQLGELLF